MISALDTFRRANVPDRKYLFDDLRGKDGLAFYQISFARGPRPPRPAN